MERRCFENRGEAPLSAVGESGLTAAACQRLEAMEKEILEDIWRHFGVACNNESVYTGGPGVAYAFTRAAALGSHGDLQCLDKARRFLEPYDGVTAKQAARRPDIACSLQCGRAGFLCVHLLLASAGGEGEADKRQAFAEFLALSRVALSSQLAADEWLYGRAGYLHGCLLFQKVLGEDAQLKRTISDLARLMLARGVENARHNFRGSHAPPVMWEWYRERYMGAAHGVVGIIFMLLHVPELLEDAQCLDTIRQTLQWLATARAAPGNWPAVLGDRRAECVHFCHGAPGAVFLYCKAYEVLREKQWLDLAQEAGELVWKYGLLKKGPGICHGIAGNGYTFLSLYRLTGDAHWLARAYHFAEQMATRQVKEQSRKPDTPYSLYEGLAGTVCFLMDLRLRPKEAAFPLFELEPEKRGLKRGPD
ncbi:unnamed protein product [Effrenium voratum]|uniref:Uncharacterized protein n=1 Tax=Effrenium voratum TaxID=2562239 RepID=A0AA36NN58_9DINO|nr:unnamed protein product [Effrenium voratum]